jgi:uncharacterized membrane protein YphA (DoxX/SURF4 family)
MKKKALLLLFLIWSITPSWSHEQWLLSFSDLERAAKISKPLIFTQVTLFNSVIVGIAILSLFLWIALTQKDKQLNTINLTALKIDYALLGLRLWTGVMLILCSLGALPKSTIPFFQEPTLFAPDLLINELPQHWHFLKWLEFGLGLSFIAGFFTRWLALILLVLIVLSLSLFGAKMYHYTGFYLAICLFLLMNSGGSISVINEKVNFKLSSLFFLQCFTGMNFIYSAVTVKWSSPNVDILLLKKTNAYTFAIPLDKFVFIMFVVEFLFGIFFILGGKMRIVSSAMLLLFIFLSYDLSENFLAHSMIYGIFTVLIILDGLPLSSYIKGLLMTTRNRKPI